MAYPTTLDTFPAAGTLATHDLDTDPHSTLHGNIGDALEAIEAKVGIDGSAVTASVDFIISNDLLKVAQDLADLNDTATARTNLGVAIGSDVQAFNANLTTLAGLTATTGNIIQSVAGAWASQTPTQVSGTLLHNSLTQLTTGDVHTQYAFLAGRAGGQTLNGGTASGDDLTLRSTANATKGTIFLGADVADQVLVGGTTFNASSAATFGVNANNTFAAAGAHLSVDFRQGPIFTTTAAALYTAVDCSALPLPTVSMASIIGVNFQAAPTGAGTATIDTVVGANAFATSAGTACTATLADSLRVQTGALVGPVITSVGVDVIGGGFLGACTNVFGVRIGTALGPSTALKVGVDIQALSGATTNIGFRNAATTVQTPTVVTLTAVGNTIAHTASVMRLNNTSGGSLTLTSAPTLTDGVDGEIVTLFNSSAQNVVIQDQGTLASSNLRLSATAITLATRDSIVLMFSSTVGDWIQVGNTNVL